MNITREYHGVTCMIILKLKNTLLARQVLRHDCCYSGLTTNSLESTDDTDATEVDPSSSSIYDRNVADLLRGILA